MTRTNAYTLLCMLIRAVAILTLATFVISLPAVAVALRNQPIAEGALGTFGIAMAVAVAVIAVLWLYADKIARLALVRPQDQAFESDIEPATWLGIAISAIGAWHLFAGVKGAIYLLPKWIVVSRAAELGMGGPSSQLVPDGVAIVAQIVLALVFLLRGAGLARLVHRLRYGAAES